MMKFIKKDNLLLLQYHPENSTQWIYDILEEKKKCTIKKTFTFTQEDLYDPDSEENDDYWFTHGMSDSILIVLAELEGDYYRFKKDILGIDVNLYMQQDIKFDRKMFFAYRNISIFLKLNSIVKEDIRIGNDENDIPTNVFLKLIKGFPNSTELRKYALARVSSIIRDYVDNSIDAKAKYEEYIDRRVINYQEDDLLQIFAENEIMKYKILLSKLQDMLRNEINYTENQWQKEILQIIQLIYPKYIRVFEEVRIKDMYQDKERRLDFLLVDSNGNIDIVEIKKPFDQSIVSLNKYRDNHIPLKELSGSVMQIEKYIYFLNKWGRDGEQKLTNQFVSDLPKNFKIKIVNPNGIIIMGRECNLTEEQLEDFEVIKRKYKNVVDIITYDELIKRLKQIIEKFEGFQGNVS